MADRHVRREPDAAPIALRLTAVARGETQASWEARLAACIELESHVRRVSAAALMPLLGALGLLDDSGARVRETVLAEGFTTCEPRAFLAELQQKLERFRELTVRHEGSIVLARYCFTPAEVVRVLVSRMRVSSGVDDLAGSADPPWVARETRRAREALPPYEREIVQRLTRDAAIYWLADATPSTCNALVEYPLGTVVLTIKSPGSDIELEIKRAGLRGPRVVEARYADEQGRPLPLHHHFWGGSMGAYLRAETASSTALASLFRQVHGQEPPISRVLARNVVLTVPAAGGGQRSLLSHFSDPSMDEAMRRSLPRLGRQGLPSGLEDFVAGSFVAAASPQQALVSGTTTFRLDKLERYLGPGGAEEYFTRGLGRPYSDAEARAFADSVLDEVLAPYERPRGPWQSYERYVEAALTLPSNRLAAARARDAAFEQMACLWGTLIGLGAYSEGESFVTRNVGLRKVWRGGAWHVAIIFMDHDGLRIARPHDSDVAVHAVLNGTFRDHTHILGGQQSHRYVPGSLAAIDAIYRMAGSDAGRRERFLPLVAESFRRTRLAMQEDAKVQALFDPMFVRRLVDWERTLLSFRPEHAAAIPRWRRNARARLHRAGHERKVIDAFLRTAVEYFDLVPLLEPVYARPVSGSASSRTRSGRRRATAR